ncbi:unnamed protein product [Adineta ricciae]|uniref:Uncharacterized protein n=1 Tax=Adineta ricciae TaxID=249248 RepID=A0A815GV80_ADIRI|nr:unnamed protein product [Adineta ricciae]CAF1343409.1 unnamed protein product [Adineta ricciae]
MTATTIRYELFTKNTDSTHVEKSGPEPTGAGFFRTFHGSKIPDRIQPVEIRPVPALPKRKSKESQQQLPENSNEP